MPGIRYVFVVCATCNAEIDRVEFDPDAKAPAVEQVSQALGVSEAAALEMVRKANPGAERASADNAQELAAAIAGGQVDGYPPAECPNGHGTDFVVSADQPTPVVSVALAKGV